MEIPKELLKIPKVPEWQLHCAKGNLFFSSVFFSVKGIMQFMGTSDGSIPVV